MKKILVAEDEQALQMLIGDTLEDEGYEVDLVSNGREALKYIQQRDYDLVILDYMMPEMTGLEVIVNVKQLPDKQDLILMVLSAKSQQADQDRVKQTGADYYMTKPFSPMVLAEKVGEILSV